MSEEALPLTITIWEREDVPMGFLTWPKRKVAARVQALVWEDAPGALRNGAQRFLRAADGGGAKTLVALDNGEADE